VTTTAAQPAAPQPAASAPPTDVVQSWGWSLLWLFLALLAGVMILVVARWLTLGGRAGLPLGRGAAKRRRPTATSSAWEEAGRRMQTPEPPPGAADLKEEP
jgi:hypothetical protein